MSEQKHTPTPWAVEKGSVIVAPGMPKRTWGQNGEFTGNFIVAQTHLYVSADSVAQDANAAFIVRACNAHEQLVAALREALAVIDDYLNYEHNGDPWTEDARAMGEMDIDDYSRDGRLGKARAALAAAEAA